MKGYKISSTRVFECVEMNSDLLPKHVKIKINRCSISNTDISNFVSDVPHGFVLGRHAVGIVGEVGQEVTGVERGNRVVLSSYSACEQCHYCRKGELALCNSMSIASRNSDGYLRDFVVSDTSNIYILPDSVSDNEGIFVEHTATALAILNKLDIKKGDHIVIAGATIVGLILAQLALYHQVVPVLLDQHQSYLDMASKLGVYYTINIVDSDPYKKIVAITGGRLSEKLALIDVGGTSLLKSLSYVVEGGVIALYGDGIGCNADQSELFGKISDRQVSIHGVNNGLKYYMPAINMIANNAVNTEPFVSATITHAQLSEYMQSMHDNPYKYVKVLVENADSY